jgi:hypothetical protein
MEPLSALSIASAVIQIVDFSSKVIAKTREVYLSADGSIEESTLLEDASSNLEDLMSGLKKDIAWRSSKVGNPSQKTSEQQLVRLAEDSQTAAGDLREVLKNLKSRNDGSDRGAVAHALRSVLGEKKVTALKEKLDEIRKQIDTTLLVALR